MRPGPRVYSKQLAPFVLVMFVRYIKASLAQIPDMHPPKKTAFPGTTPALQYCLHLLSFLPQVGGISMQVFFKAAETPLTAVLACPPRSFCRSAIFALTASEKWKVWIQARTTAKSLPLHLLGKHLYICFLDGVRLYSQISYSFAKIQLVTNVTSISTSLQTCFDFLFFFSTLFRQQYSDKSGLWSMLLKMPATCLRHLFSGFTCVFVSVGVLNEDFGDKEAVMFKCVIRFLMGI